MSVYLLWFVSSVVCGAAGRYVFARKGWNPYYGFALGFALNVIGLVLWSMWKKGKRS